MKNLIAMFILSMSFNATLAMATTSPKIIVGALANNNLLQGNVIESSSVLDIAISGNGFIPLQNAQGEILYSRYGVLGMDKSGDLEHIPSGLKVVIPDEKGNFKTVHLESFAEKSFFNQSKRLAKLTSMSFNDSGSLEGMFSDGQVVTIAKLQLAVFENQRKLRVADEKKYLLRSTKAVGKIAYLPPGDHPVGKLFGHHLESVSMNDYKKALQ